MTLSRAVRILLILPVVCLVVPSISRSQNATIGVYEFFNGASACPLAPGQTYLLAVKVAHTFGPVKTAKFKLVPSCPGAIVSGPLDYDLTLSTCATDGSVLAVLSVTPPVTCGGFGFYFDVRGPAGEYTIPLTDCDGYPMTGVDAFETIDYGPCEDLSGLIAPYRPTPADGATDVPVNTLLSYVGTANTIQLSTQPLTIEYDDHVICGPAYCFPSLPGLQGCSYPINPGTLAPNTTYYWRASTWAPTHEWCIGASSQVFTFTTGDGPVAARATTWGHVKAMYRE